MAIFWIVAFEQKFELGFYVDLKTESKTNKKENKKSQNRDTCVMGRSFPAGPVPLLPCGPSHLFRTAQSILFPFSFLGHCDVGPRQQPPLICVGHGGDTGWRALSVRVVLSKQFHATPWEAQQISGWPAEFCSVRWILAKTPCAWAVDARDPWGRGESCPGYKSKFGAPSSP